MSIEYGCVFRSCVFINTLIPHKKELNVEQNNS